MITNRCSRQVTRILLLDDSLAVAHQWKMLYYRDIRHFHKLVTAGNRRQLSRVHSYRLFVALL